MKRTFIFIIIFISLFSLENAQAGYFSSGVIIKNNADAMIVCNRTCKSRILGQWTGEWFTTPADEYQVTVCECLYDWPYCPYFRPGASPLTCTIKYP